MRRLRVVAKMTVRRLASEVGISATHLCDIEHGRRAPSDQLLQRFVRKLSSAGASYEKLQLLKPVVDKDIREWYAGDYDVRLLMREAKDSEVPAGDLLRLFRSALGGQWARSPHP